MLKSKKGRDLASRISSDLVLPESDGPFATLNGKPNHALGSDGRMLYLE
jgi:Tat protein secretion system quality control protein TatD with DNase activity